MDMELVEGDFTLLVSFILVNESLHSFPSAWTPHCHTLPGPIFTNATRCLAKHEDAY